MNRSLHVTAVAAFIAWSALAVSIARGPTDDTRRIALTSARPDQLERIEYTSPSLSATLVASSDARGEFLWATTRRDPNPADHDDAIITSEFKVSADVSEMIFSALAPLDTPRIWEDPDEELLEELHIGAQRDRVELFTTEDHIALELGRASYGSRRVYAKLEGSSAVALDAQLVNALRFADTRLPERALTGLELIEITSVKLQRGPQQLTLTQHNQETPELIYWQVDEMSGQSVRARRWMTRLSKLKASEYVPCDSLHGYDEVVTLELRGSGSYETERARLLVSSGTTRPRHVYRSDWLRGCVALYPVAAALVSDVDALLDAPRTETMLAPPEFTEHVH